MSISSVNQSQIIVALTSMLHSNTNCPNGNASPFKKLLPHLTPFLLLPLVSLPIIPTNPLFSP